MNTTSQKILLSPIFLLGLFLLLLNDFFLKAQFGNFLTGKLSDFAGLFIFPLFFAAFFPERKTFIYLSTAVLFAVWKSPISQNLFDFWNSLEIFRIGRTIDYSDFSALIVLPISYFYFNILTKPNNKFSYGFTKRIFAGFVVLFSIFSFTATSFEENRSVWIEKKYEIRLTKSDFEKQLKGVNLISGIKIRNEKDVFPSNQYPEVKTNQNSYNVNFNLRTKYCDSDVLRIFFGIEEEKDFIIIKFINFDYWCKQKPTEIDEQKLITIFEGEVIEKLRQNNAQ